MAIGSRRYQYLAGICVNIISISYGAFCGWPSASFLTLQSDESPLETGPITFDEAGSISSMLCIGGAIGTIIFSWTVEKWGRRMSLMLIAIPSLLSWLIIPFARTPTDLSLSRLIGGLAGGGTFSVIPLYITEVADNKVRGVLGTFLLAIGNAGILVAYILGYYFSYSTVAWIMVVPVLIFLLCFSFLPETPQYLIKKNKVDEAEKAFRYLRNIRTAVPELPADLKSELEKLKDETNSDNKVENYEYSITWRDIVHPKAVKAISIGIGLMSLNQFCGILAMLNYNATIFQISGSNVSPNMAAIIIGVIQIFGAYVSALLIDRCGRKILLCGSAVGTALGHIGLGSYIYLNLLGYDLSSFTWIPVASFSFAIFAACCGVLPVAFILNSELMPSKIRNVGCMISMLSLWIFAFTMFKLMPFFLKWIGLDGMLFMCAGYCLGSIIFIIVFIPETKGKSIESILALL